MMDETRHVGIVDIRLTEYQLDEALKIIDRSNREIWTAQEQLCLLSQILLGKSVRLVVEGRNISCSD
ncbi:MAG TPA: hypothetical protein DIT67_13080 [Octadecabacter sp.]|nr:hypothetical protein [Octadecabacter sp.]